MQVVKRNGTLADVKFDKITNRIAKLCDMTPTLPAVNILALSQKVVQGVHDRVHTTQLDELAAETAAYLTTEHPDYGILASRLFVSNLHKNTNKSFYLSFKQLYDNGNIDSSVFQFVRANRKAVESTIKHERDYSHDYFGLKTLEKSYLMRIDSQLVERPQYMYMRVAVGIHYATNDLAAALETYELMSTHKFTHASPTLFNSGCPNAQMSSCFLVANKDDSIDGIFDTVKECAMISKNAGGIGLHVHDVRATGSAIKGTNGVSNGLVPMLRVFNNTARYVDQCVDASTIIAGMPDKPIAQLQVGDYVLTHDGTYQQVLDINRFEIDEPTICINGTIMTSHHPLLVKGTQRERMYYTLEQIDGHVWVDACDIKLDDEIMMQPGAHIPVYSCFEIDSQPRTVYDLIVAKNHTYVTPTGVVHNGGGKRKGAFAVYLEPWHADIFEFLELKRNHGIEDQRARDLFYALWVPDLFMRRVESDDVWSLFCPTKAPGLSDTHGKAFDELYKRYESSGVYNRQVKARELWAMIIESQIETGTPYMLYKDACNSKSNQQNLGTIKCSNLCTEIVEYTSPDETAVCNLASISLPSFVVDSDDASSRYDFEQLEATVRVITRNLNKIIDINFYPVPTARASNLKHRPIGIGVQGLADVFAMLSLEFDSQQARQLNKQIFESIYFAACVESCELARRDGAYESYQGSPISNGQFQFDLWGVEPESPERWSMLRKRIMQHGMRNSLLVAPMPTASTSQILGNNECFEPFTSNVYTRRVLAGEFVVINKHLLRQLIELGIWSRGLKNELVRNNGSVQSLNIPDKLKHIYKTVWEIKQRAIIDMAKDRGVYIDQSQSLNLHIRDVNYAKLTSMHFYAWKSGLKTGMYYLRTQSAVDAVKVTVDAQPDAQSEMACALDNREACMSCGS